MSVILPINSCYDKSAIECTKDISNCSINNVYAVMNTKSVNQGLIKLIALVAREHNSYCIKEFGPYLFVGLSDKDLGISRIDTVSLDDLDDYFIIIDSRIVISYIANYVIAGSAIDPNSAKFVINDNELYVEYKNLAAFKIQFGESKPTILEKKGN